MDAVATTEKKPHVICVPLPAQSHIQAMLKLAELLHYMGLQVTFVNTENIHKQLLKSGGVHSLDGSSDFRFETIPDGVPRASVDDDHVPKLLLHYVETTFLTPFLDLATKLPTPPTCIISDGFMSLFTIDAAKKLGIPVILYWTLAACGFMGIYQNQSLIDKGLPPLKAQSHIKAMLKLAEYLHHKGLQITFVNTENIHKRLLNSGGLHCLDGSPGFRFETIPDGIPRSSEDDNGTHGLMDYVETSFLTPFVDLAAKLPNTPTCIISDGFMSVFTIEAAKELGIPIMLYWTLSACGFMGIYQVQSLIDKGLAPLKDKSCLTNGYLETIIDWIPGMEGIRLKDMNSIIRTTDPDDKLLKLCTKATQKCHNVSHNIIHTFDALEASIVDALSFICPRVYTVGPLQLLLSKIPEEEKQSKMLNFNGYNLRKEEPECFQWLQSKEANSVIYVNFGSTTVMPLQHLIEFAWGLADSNHYFLWIIRSDLVVGDSSALPPEFEEHLEKRGFIASWCSQEKVLNHPSVGGFLTHCGWGSTIESLSAGVPMICWPYLWDQVTNCRYICKEWEVGLEMGKDVKREEVSKLVQELMGENGHGMRIKATEWKEKALAATAPNGSSSLNINNLIEEIIVLSRN